MLLTLNLITLPCGPCGAHEAYPTPTQIPRQASHHHCSPGDALGVLPQKCGQALFHLSSPPQSRSNLDSSEQSAMTGIDRHGQPQRRTTTTLVQGCIGKGFWRGWGGGRVSRKSHPPPMVSGLKGQRKISQMPGKICDRGPQRTFLQKIQLKISGLDHGLEEEDGGGEGGRGGTLLLWLSGIPTHPCPHPSAITLTAANDLHGPHLRLRKVQCHGGLVFAKLQQLQIVKHMDGPLVFRQPCRQGGLTQPVPAVRLCILIHQNHCQGDGVVWIVALREWQISETGRQGRHSGQLVASYTPNCIWMILGDHPTFTSFVAVTTRRRPMPHNKPQPMDNVGVFLTAAGVRGKTVLRGYTRPPCALRSAAKSTFRVP